MVEFRKLFFLVLLFSHLIVFGQNKQLKSNLLIEIGLTDLWVNENYKCSDSGQLREIQVFCINTSKDTLKYWMMACSRSDYFIANTKSVSFCKESCRGNYPYLMELMPNQQDTFYLNLSIKSVFDSTFKIAFLMLEESEAKTFRTNKTSIIDRNIGLGNIIWSKWMYIKKEEL